MADFMPDALSQILAGKVAPPAPAPQPAAPIVDPRFGRRPIPMSVASGPGVTVPPTQIQAGPGVAIPQAAPNLAPTMVTPNLQATSDARNIPAPDINTQRRVDANNTQAEAAPTREQYKPGKLRSILGMLSTFAMGMGGVPHAAEVGEHAINSPYYNAMDSWKTRQDQAKNIIGEEDKQYGNLAKVYGQTLTNDFNRTREADRVAHNKELETTKDRLATVQEQNARTKADAIDNKQPKTWQEAQSMASAEKDPAEKKRLTDLYTSMRNDELGMRRAGKDNSLAEDRMEERRTKNLDQVQKDADNAVKAHKKAIQSRIDKLDETDPGYKSKLAQIERDDYQGMGAIGQQFASRSSRFGAKFNAPKPEPWEESNLKDDEREKLLGGSSPKSGKTEAAKTAPVPQAFPLKESGGHKAGDVVTLKDGSRVKITGFNKNGQFSHVPAGN